MSEVMDSLTGVLSSIQQNRLQLANQMPQIELQLKNATEQLKAFDTLIAALQVVITDEQVLEQVQNQVGANSEVPLTSPSVGAGEPVEGAANAVAAIDHSGVEAAPDHA